MELNPGDEVWVKFSWNAGKKLGIHDPKKCWINGWKVVLVKETLVLVECTKGVQKGRQEILKMEHVQKPKIFK